MTTDVSTLPNAEFHPFNGTFPNMVTLIVAGQQHILDALNVTGNNAFHEECAKWLSAATLARNAGSPLPPKPLSPASWVLLVQDGTKDSQSGKWIAQAQAGPIYGVCPDLPAAIPSNPSTGSGYSGPQQQYSQDQKLDSISLAVADNSAILRDISERMRKAGI